jgi:2-polyprenyl-3-methyl-5-hydroxy-6-metoxy-1,4-benzoquinol methylase
VLTNNLPYTQKLDRFSSHARIATMICAHADNVAQVPHRVLDVGCAYGFLRNYLPSPRFYLIGVDINEQAVEKARTTYDEVYCADVTESVELPLTHMPHTIVFGDILEHLPNPETILKKILERYARPQTQVIVSLPNVAHLYIRLMLLLGRFHYTERGILDRTHLRFFTRQTAMYLLEANHLKVTTVDSTPVPLPLVNRAFAEEGILFPLHVINDKAAKVFKSALAYQFVLEAYYDRR